MKKLSIRLKIGHRVYPFDIDPQQEEIYRKAAQEINEQILWLESNYDLQDRTDTLAYCALTFAIPKVQKEFLSQAKEAQNRAELEKINELLDGVLARFQVPE